MIFIKSSKHGQNHRKYRYDVFEKEPLNYIIYKTLKKVQNCKIKLQ